MSCEFWLWRQVDADRQLIRGLKSPRYSYPRLSDDLIVGPSLYSTDLKVRGYLNSRLPDEFPIVSSIREDNRMVGNRRLEDAMPKANSRGFLNPWN